jgi:class 3 adenylate cyclase
MAGFGGMTFLAVALVLWLGFWSGTQNTFSLFGQLGGLAVENMEATLDRHLDPARALLDHIGHRIEAGDLDPADTKAMESSLAGAVAATPQLTGVAFFYSDYRSIQIQRQDKAARSRTIDVSQEKMIRTAVDQARDRRGAYWGDIVHVGKINSSLINARRPVYVDGAFAGLLAASISVAQLSSLFGSGKLPEGGTGFVLYDDKYLLAHPKLASGFAGASESNPLATVNEVGDQVLIAFLNPDRPGAPRRRRAVVPGVELVGIDDDTYVPLLSREIDGYGDKTWRIGVYLPPDREQLELKRLTWAGSASVAVLIIAMAFAWYLSRRLSRPLKQLAVAADRIRELRFGEVPALAESRIHELNEANQAFSAMTAALRWFESYVPKTLVRKLMAADEKASHSEQRQVTIMFSDINGFTALAEPLSAERTAHLLNDHFAILARAIENEGGTIDKFIGDAVMAFWGAPDDTPDHADRACRAALAIRRAIEADNIRRREINEIPISVRLGLHTGSVTIGNIGAPGRINYTVVGDTVNIANRIEDAAKPAAENGADVAIALSEETTAALSEETRRSLTSLRPFGRHRLRGRSGELNLFAL